MSTVQLGFNEASCGIQQYNYEAPATNCIYAAPNGVATNPGTLSSPTTLASAVSKVVHGGTIVLRGGTYRDVGEFTMIPSKVWSLQAYQNEVPIVDGTKNFTSSWTAEGAAFKTPFSYVHKAPVAPMDNAQYRTNAQFLKNFHQIFVNNKYLNQVGTLAECVGNKFYIDDVAKQVYIGINPAGKTVSYSSKMWFLSVSSNGNLVVTPNVSFKGIQFNGYADVCIRTTIKDMLIENCKVTQCGKTGILMNGQVIVKNCHVTDIGMRGIGGSNFLGKVSNTIVENPVIYPYSFSWECAGIKISGNPTTYVTNIAARTMGVDGLIENCKVTRDIALGAMEAIGIWFDVHASRSVVRNNYIENYNVGILHEISQSNSFYGNSIIKCNVGFQHWHSQGAIFVNNTIVDAAYAISVIDGGRRDLDKYTHDVPSIKVHYITRGLKAYNNLLIGSRYTWDDTRFIHIQVYPGESSAAYITESKNNIFARTYKTVNGVQKSLPVNIYRAFVAGAYKLIPTVSQARTDLSLEQNSKAIPPTEQVVNASYIPISASVINAGIPLTAELSAVLELPIGTLTDVGAFQSRATTAPPTPEPETDPPVNPCASYIETIATLEQSIDDLESSLIDKDTQIAQLRGNLEVSQASLMQTSQNLSAANAEIASLQNSVHDLNASMQGLQTQLTTANAEIASLQTQLTTATTTSTNLMLLALEEYVKHYLVSKQLAPTNTHVKVLISDSTISVPNA